MYDHGFIQIYCIPEISGKVGVSFYCSYFSTCNHEWNLGLLSRRKEAIFQWCTVEKDNKTSTDAPLFNSLKDCQRLGKGTYLSCQQRVLKGFPASPQTRERERSRPNIQTSICLTHFEIELFKLVAKLIQMLHHVRLSLHPAG